MDLLLSQAIIELRPDAFSFSHLKKLKKRGKMTDVSRDKNFTSKLNQTLEAQQAGILAFILK